MSATSDDCIFCTIVAGEIPAEVLGRTEHAIAFKDLNPQAPFHALVVPLDKPVRIDGVECLPGGCYLVPDGAVPATDAGRYLLARQLPG